MSGEAVEYEVRIRGSNGKEYTISFDGLRERLLRPLRDSVDERFEHVYTRLGEIEQFIMDFQLVPPMEERILNLIRGKPNIKTREINAVAPSERLHNWAWHKAFQKLKEEKPPRIIGTTQGRGRNRTWKVDE